MSNNIFFERGQMADKPNIEIRLSDNLELMAEMQDKTVDLIYCDILYGTGRKFKDYQDLKPKREVIEEHYIPRIKEMHRILKDTGSIYLQMDYKISHWLRCILDDVFGYENMVNQIIWNYQRWANSTKNFTRQNDHILFYSKSKKYTFNNLYEPFSDKSKHKGKRYSEWENGSLKTKKYVNNDRLKNMSDVWNISYLNPMSKEKNGYNTQKPKVLIERIIKASSNEGDLVADFYAGSFTTAEVCKDLNRNFIGCDISEKAVEIGKKRVEKNILLRANEPETLFDNEPKQLTIPRVSKSFYCQNEADFIDKKSCEKQCVNCKNLKIGQ